MKKGSIQCVVNFPHPASTGHGHVERRSRGCYDEAIPQ